jgi:Kef-type K+ transport system membrane component KefB
LVGVIVACIVLLATIDTGGSSAGSLIYAVLPVYAVVAIILIWIGVLAIRSLVRFVNRNAKLPRRAA